MIGAGAGEEEQARQRLLERVAAQMNETAALTGRRDLSAPVLRALATVPRHHFVPQDQRDRAYVNAPLPIGCGQTISQPYIVALMTELLEPTPEAVILEIGTGSGYQTAILAQLARQVYSVERLPELAAAAAERLRALRYENISIRTGDGGQGWAERAPFDGVIVTAAAATIPAALVRQLKPGGRLVIPVGLPHRTQDLRLLRKDQQGELSSRSILPVAFVPLICAFEEEQ